jgi:glycosyltransferase involved in cell wall biosynthesis
MSKKNALIIVYTHIEGYPPSLNALNELAKSFDTVQVLVINNQETSWQYPKNVTLIECGDYFPTWDIVNKKNIDKIKDFTQFIVLIRKLLQSKEINLVVSYSPISLFAYWLLQKMLSKKNKPLLWYHNHDVMELSKTKKYTIAWVAALVEKNIFDKLDFFSLPAQDRKQYFPLENLKGKYFYIPNVPAKSFYNQFYQPKTVKVKTIKLIFQGTIAKGHGLEEVIKYILPTIIADKNFELNLKGLISDDYKNELLQLAVINNVEKQVIFHGFGAYQDVPRIASACHIGIAIHKGTDIMNKTLGTSSNKIYEYAAVGLPVLLFDNEHFREHLEKYTWAFFTDTSEKSLFDCIEKIIANYEYLSQKAHEDFESHLNFETYFTPVIEEVMQRINTK